VSERFLDVVPAPSFVAAAPDAEMCAAAKRHMGGVLPSALTFLTPVPWMFDLHLQVIKPPVTAAPQPLLELAAFVTSFENACRHCYGAQRSILRMVGRSDAWIDRLERDAQRAELDEQQRSVLELARKLARSSPRPARAEKEALARAYGPAAAVEIAFKIAGTCYTNRVATFLSLPPDPGSEGLARAWFLPLIRPLVRKMVRRNVKGGPPIPLDGPFRGILDAMGSVPVTFVMRRAIDGALESQILPRRTKLLVFAVVARSLTCATCEPEVARLLETTGLSTADLGEILKNLRSPKLDDLETTLVGFARESVRYQYLQAQELVRQDLAPRLRAPELLEAIGVCALANSVVRLAMLAA
jgi:alkylhydroperoxidase family enzyme